MSRNLLLLASVAALVGTSLAATPPAVTIKVSPRELHACAEDKDVARMSAELVVEATNTGRSNLIISSTVESPVPLRPVSVMSGNFDDFRTVALPKIAVSERPPESFVTLRPGEVHSFVLQGWFLVSRGKHINGTVPRGTMDFVGLLDPWPYDSSNYSKLAKKWKKWGRLQKDPIKLPTFRLHVVVPEHLDVCTTQ